MPARPVARFSTSLIRNHRSDRAVNQFRRYLFGRLRRASVLTAHMSFLPPNSRLDVPIDVGDRTPWAGFPRCDSSEVPPSPISHGVARMILARFRCFIYGQFVQELPVILSHVRRKSPPLRRICTVWPADLILRPPCSFAWPNCHSDSFNSAFVHVGPTRISQARESRPMLLPPAPAAIVILPISTLLVPLVTLPYLRYIPSTLAIEYKRVPNPPSSIISLRQ